MKNYLLALEIGNKPGGSSGNNDPSTDSLIANDPSYELKQFYFHPDHLGSSNYLSDIRGEVYQHTEYLPFGEVFVEERNTGQDRAPYLYNGKELDVMTGLYCYGARYYDPRASIFLGVDPQTERSVGMSPYLYVDNNPLYYIDPDGEYKRKAQARRARNRMGTYKIGYDRVSDVYYNETKGEWGFMVFEEGKHSKSWSGKTENGEDAVFAYRGIGIYDNKTKSKYHKKWKRTVDPYRGVRSKMGNLGKDNEALEVIEWYCLGIQDPLGIPFTDIGPAGALQKIQENRNNNKEEQQQGEKNEQESSNETSLNNNSQQEARWSGFYNRLITHDIEDKVTIK